MRISGREFSNQPFLKSSQGILTHTQVGGPPNKGLNQHWWFSPSFLLKHLKFVSLAQRTKLPRWDKKVSNPRMDRITWQPPCSAVELSRPWREQALFWYILMAEGYAALRHWPLMTGCLGCRILGDLEKAVCLLTPPSAQFDPGPCLLDARDIRLGGWPNVGPNRAWPLL